MSLKTLLEKILPFLFTAAEKQWDALTKEQQAAILNGSGGFAQIIKNNLDLGEVELKQLISEKTGLPLDVVNATFDAIAKELNVSSDTVVVFIQASLKEAENTLNWNGLLTTIGSIAAIVLSGGSITWESLLMGLLQFAYKKFVQGK